jgi:hypothetical protein
MYVLILTKVKLIHTSLIKKRNRQMLISINTIDKVLYLLSCTAEVKKILRCIILTFWLTWERDAIVLKSFLVFLSL